MCKNNELTKIFYIYGIFLESHFKDDVDMVKFIQVEGNLDSKIVGRNN